MINCKAWLPPGDRQLDPPSSSELVHRHVLEPNTRTVIGMADFDVAVKRVPRFICLQTGAIRSAGGNPVFRPGKYNEVLTQSIKRSHDGANRERYDLKTQDSEGTRYVVD